VGNCPFEKNCMLAIPAFNRATAASRSPKQSSIDSATMQLAVAREDPNQPWTSERRVCKWPH
jgi:hypothetical protein